MGDKSPATLRIFSLDVFRGLCLAVMAVDHFGGPITKLTQQTVGFVSVAEGFVFISGLVAGLVYGRLALLQPQRLRRASLKRAYTIYAVHLGTVYAFMMLAYVLPEFAKLLKTSTGFFPDQPHRVAIAAALLLHQPLFLDILPIYVLFLIAMPWAIQQFIHGRHKRVLLLSGVFWLAAQFDLRQGLLTVMQQTLGVRVTAGLFDPMAWQVLFVLGLWLGTRKAQSGAWQLPLRQVPVSVWMAILAALFIFRHLPMGETILASSPFADRQALGWLRLVNFLVLAYGISLLSHRLPSGWLMNWFAFLGRHSLQVYVFHTVFLYLILPAQPVIDNLSDPWQVALSLLFAASMSLPALWHQIWRDSRESRQKMVPDPMVRPRPVNKAR